MAKRKIFEKSDQALPVTGAELGPAGAIQFPVVSIPPAVTKVKFGRVAGDNRSFDFKDFYGHRIDQITFACQRQIERFVEGEDRKLAPTSILNTCQGATHLLDYLIARGTAEAREFRLKDINRSVIDGYLGWLRDSYTSVISQSNAYHSAKCLLDCFGKRGLVTIIAVGDDRTFPRNPFPGADKSAKGAKPLPKAQRQALARALRDAVLPLFHPYAVLDGYLLTAALFMVALYTGRNATPLLEMTPDCLRAHPKAGMLFLVLFKRRGYSTNKVALRAAQDEPGREIELTPTVRPNVASLIQRVIALGEPLRAEAHDHLKNRVWIFRSKADQCRGAPTGLSETTVRRHIAALVKAYALTDAEGKPLRINISRLRKTFVNRMFEILDGDIVTAAIAAGHAAPQTTGTNYLRPSENAQKNWQFMGQVLTDQLLSGSVQTTPVAHCSDPINGQFALTRDGATCMNFLNCLRCRNYVVTSDDLYKLFSFEQRIWKERSRMDKRKWSQHLAHIPRLIERDVVRPGIEQKKFKPADVEAARARAKQDPHPFWLVDSLVGDLESLA